MPELPEVETLVRRLREPVIGRTIEVTTIHWKRTVARPAPQEFTRMLRGYTVQSIDRRAKYLVFTLTPHASTPLRSAQACGGNAYSLPIDSSQNEWQTECSRSR